MLNITKQKLPGKNNDTKTVSKPIEIPVKREYARDHTSNSTPVSTPPNEFIEQLQRRMHQFATSPGVVYNLRN
jgi:hypothetical protein